MVYHDRGEYYNAFGRDPNGRLAFLASFFFGPAYVPAITLQQFAGPPEPPRYGPPARYQLSCLPAGFQPRRPPNFLDPEDTNSIPELPYLEPPEVFDRNLFAAFQHVSRFQQFMPGLHIACHQFKVLKDSLIPDNYQETESETDIDESDSEIEEEEDVVQSDGRITDEEDSAEVEERSEEHNEPTEDGKED
ncbi:hypothetical protein Hypma_016574 [Hypsizygus marmoreus]|uniref:Uncharacterized protein n=1 Tax=Hypsizygus marmoreus TaxID=39966 RepID=A0A369J127_HYPMA|nr:hypothetical protein Hypma_016574 [Hypsizygus marmoreus]